MSLFGLIGYPLSHSFSKKYFSEKFIRENISECAYELFPLKTINEFPDLLEKEKLLKGANVTIPYKQTIIPFLDTLDEKAREVGAVNTISIQRDTEGEIISLSGFNTDVTGFEISLLPFLKPFHTRALILGTGGASKAVQYVLRKLTIEYSLVSRKKDVSGKNYTYEELNEQIIREHPVIINTSPLGMHPNIENCPPIPYMFITSRHLLYDLVYNPENTEFMKKGQAMGAAVKNGLEMLCLQAEEAWKIWNR